MHYTGSVPYRRLVWFVIFSFLFSSTPNVELAASGGWDFLCRLAVLSEAHAGEIEEDTAQTATKGSVDAEENAGETRTGEVSPEEQSVSLTASSSSEDKGSSAVAGSLTPTVDISQFSGAAGITVPIEVPPGRMNMAPRLSLTYNSYLGNGWMGVGWNLDMGSIQRSAKRGVNYGANDFAASTGGSTAELTPRGDRGSNHYGSTIEGALSKYYYNTSTGGWEMTSRDGTRYYYGSTSASRQDFDGGNHVFKWCLDRVVDVHGNYMTVTYVKDQGEIYLNAILYTGNEKTGLNPTVSIRFPLEGRPDAPPVYAANYPVTAAYRLSSIDVYVNNVLQKSYVMKGNYATSVTTGRSLLTSVIQYGKDGASSLPATEFIWHRGAPGWTSTGGTSAFSVAEGYTDANRYPIFTGDFNGDGKTDIGRVHGSGVAFMLSTGTGWTPMAGITNLSPTHGYTNADTFPMVIGDFNGDGRTDVGRVHGSGVTIALSTGTGWTWTTGLSSFGPSQGYTSAGTYPIFTGDFNGDGKMDIGRVHGSGVAFYLSTGTGWTPMAGITNLSPTHGYTNADTFPMVIGDFNGDGSTDVGRVHGSGVAIALSTGTGWTWTTGLSSFGPSQGYTSAGTYPIFTGDFNGDGKTDIGRVHGSGVAFMLSDGTGWTPMAGITNLSPTHGYTNADTFPMVIGDFNGDGRTDVGRVHGSGVTVALSTGTGWTWMTGLTSFGPSQGYTNAGTYPIFTGDFNGDGKTDVGRVHGYGVAFAVAAPSPSDLVSAVVSPLGATTTISYTPSSVYKNTLLPFILQTVSSVTTDDGRGNSYTVRHAYEGGLYDYTDREFRGFRKSTSHQMADPQYYESQTETWYHQDHTRKGLIEAQLVTAAEGHTRQVNNTYAAVTLAAGVTWPRLDTVQTSVTDAGYPAYTTAVDYVYDLAYLTVLEEHRYGMEDSDDVHTSMTYTNLTGPWIIGKPSDVTVKGPSGSIVGRKWMDYSSATGSLLTEEICASDTPAAGCGSRGSALNPVVSYTYSPEGNVSSVTDPRGYKTTFAYDATKTFATDTVNALGHRTSKTYDPATGKVLSLTPPHLEGSARAVTYSYDVFGRPAGEMRPDGGWTSYSYHNGGNPSSQYVQRIEHTASADQAADHYSYTLFDGLGRVYSVWSSGPDDLTIVVDTAYDSVGRPYRKSRPYFQGIDTPVYVAMEYDGLSREIATTFPDGGQVLTAYQGLVKQVRDQKGNWTAYTYDVNRRLRQVTDPAGTVTDYTYDTPGNLVRVIAAKGQPEQNVTTMTYDSLSKKRSMTDPDMGKWTYTYDRSGNLASQTDPYGQRITFDYDGANRLTRKAYTYYANRETEGALKAYAITYTYDDPSVPYAKGMLTKTTGSSSGKKEDSVLSLDIMQRVTKSKKVIDGSSVTIAKTYDSAGRTVTQTYFPDTMQARTLSYTYDVAGNTVAVYDSVLDDDHVQYMVHNASGQPGYALYPKSDGSFLRTAYTYDTRTGRLSRLLTEKVGQGTQTVACGMLTKQPVVPCTYTCDLTAQTFGKEQDCTNACLQTGTCTASAPATISGSASGSAYSVSAGGSTLSFTCGGNSDWGYTTCACGSITSSTGTFSGSVSADRGGGIYSVSAGGSTLNFTCGYDSDSGVTTYSCGSITSSTGTFSGSASSDRGGTIYAISASGTTLNFTCGGGNSDWGITTYSCGSITYTSTPVYTCPLGSGYACDANHACQRTGTCTAKTGGLQCPDGYTLTGNTCVSHTCPLGSRYACSGTPVTCTGITSGTGIPIQDFSYEYDLTGNVTTLTDTVNSITHTYTYDTLNRLLTATGEGEKGYTQSYCYDRIGNITYRSDVGTYIYTYANKPHAVRQAGSISLDYDRVGNMTKKARTGGPTLTISWNPDNKPELIEKNGSSYIRFSYDSSGTRVKKENLQTGSTTTYFGDAYEKRDSTGIIHVYANNHRIASIRTDGRTQYYHTNHLGSSSVITDDRGNTKETIDYHPFGTYHDRQDLDASFPDANYTFTGQEDDDETGLYNYNARLYDPELGRFISADSIIPEPGNLQAFNRYSYCVNNPLVYVDPSGHFSLDDFVNDFISGFVSAVTFCAVFAATFPVLGPAAVVPASAAAGAAYGATSTALYGGNLTQVLQAAGQGAAMGAAAGGLIMMDPLFGVSIFTAGAIQAYNDGGLEGLAHMGSSMLGAMAGNYTAEYVQEKCNGNAVSDAGQNGVESSREVYDRRVDDLTQGGYNLQTQTERFTMLASRVKMDNAEAVGPLSMTDVVSPLPVGGVAKLASKTPGIVTKVIQSRWFRTHIFSSNVTRQGGSVMTFFGKLKYVGYRESRFGAEMGYNHSIKWGDKHLMDW